MALVHNIVKHFSILFDSLHVWYILGLFKLLSALDGISFILGPPLSNLAVGLGHATLQLSLCFLLFLKLLPQEVAVMACRLNSMGQGILGLFVGEGEGVKAFYILLSTVCNPISFVHA